MAIAIAIMEPTDHGAVLDVARFCATHDHPLHLIGPIGEDVEVESLSHATVDGNRVDLWVHPGWFDFRDAIARERCFYFGKAARGDLRRAVLPSNAVLLFPASGALPERLLDKHPKVCFRPVKDASTLGETVMGTIRQLEHLAPRPRGR